VDWVPESQTVNQVCYKEVLTNLRERVRRRRPEMWKNGSWVLHQDNATAHNALSVKTFLTKHKITVLEHPPYSPNLAPCDFFLFPKIKSALKGTRFESINAAKAKATQLMNKLPEDQGCQIDHLNVKSNNTIEKKAEQILIHFSYII